MSSTKLGRGLSTLIPDKSYINGTFDNVNMVDEDEGTKNEEKIYLNLKIELVVANSMQHRKNFDDNSIKELAQSIKSNGVIQPIMVRKIDDKYEIIAGERRWRAAKIAGLTNIPVIIKNVNDKNVLEIAIIENVQREDINAIEEAEAYKKLIDDFSYTHEGIGIMVGKSRTYITNILRILSLPNSVQDMIKNKSISIGHAKAIINAKNVEEIAKTIVEKSLNVRQVEEMMKSDVVKNKAVKNKIYEEKNKDLLLLEEKISENLGMMVKIKDNNNIGTVCINFRNLEELNVILRKLT